MDRVYLDWNATSPLCAEARRAMIEAMDVVGNPSSVHAEGRAAKALVERARGVLLEALGASSGADLVFTSGATEAAALALAGRELHAAPVEHDAVLGWVTADLPVDGAGRVIVTEPERSTLQWANSETGVVQELPKGLAVSDITQGFGRLPFAWSWSGVEAVFLSAHKFGGPKGVGCLVIPEGLDLPAQIRGGGQEMGRRSGTENVIGIAGMAAAAAAAQRDLADGVWVRVAEFRNILESAIADASKETIFVGKSGERLPNTSCMVTPGWKGETQVMNLDLAGFAISAGSACSSGKVRENRVLGAMGFKDEAGCAIRVSLGPTTTKDEVLRFADAWIARDKKRRTRAG